MPAYSKTYLHDAMINLGEAIHTGCHEFSLSPDDFMNLFIISGISSQFENGNPKYICGKSGRELAFDVYQRVYGAPPSIPAISFIPPSSPEYWAGWILADYQWFSSKSFKSIHTTLPIAELVQMYHPFHEADERKTFSVIENRLLTRPALNRLQEYRRLMELSQSELSQKSGVNIRSIQQYEIGAKDIKKASVSTVLALSKALSCQPEDLLI